MTASAAEEVTFNILGMTCKSCVARIESAIRAVPGVVDTKVTLVTARARVQFKIGAGDSDAVLQAVARAGYAIDPASVPDIRELQCSTLRMRMRRFEAYLPKPLARWVLRNSDTARVASVERQVTVMFTDIVGFTTQAEGRPATAIADFLNEHFALVAECIDAEGGTIDKFIGDAVMAFWIASQRLDHELSACRAARAIAHALNLDNARRHARGDFMVRLRIGIHAGPVVIGSIGSPSRMNYTIVGDTVNTAQRLEQFAKGVASDGRHVTAIVSETIAARLPQSFFLTPLGSVSLRGRLESIRAFRLHADDD
jgi:class 3 adenylate cyclase/copper chaperone CopZ